MFEYIASSDVFVVSANAAMWSAPLLPEEERYVVGAAERRRREFAAGRACAREALTELGISPVAIPRNPDRTPAWPAGVVGSITHCHDYCAAAVCRRASIVGVGIDVEDVRPLEDRVAELVCTPRERALLSGLTGLGPQIGPKLVFSAKESFYKSYYPETKTFLEFADVEVELFPDKGRFVARLTKIDAPAPLGMREFSGSFAVAEGHVFTMLTIARAVPQRPPLVG